MRLRTAFGVVIGACTLVGGVPLAVASAGGNGGSHDEDHASEEIWLAEETDLRFVTRAGEELTDEGGAVLELTAELSGQNELAGDPLEPGAGDPDGTGDATVTLSEDGEICWEINVANITLPAAAAHIHEGAADVNGGVVVPLTAPDESGVAADCTDAEPGLVEDIASNPAGYYVNVHTSDFPDGAVRGQLSGGFGADPGDRIFLTEDLFASDDGTTKGEAIGHTVIQCTFGLAESAQCTGTAFLDDRGQVHISATILLTEESAPFDVAVIGGTGDFASSGGEATITDQEPEGEGPSTSIYEVRLQDLAR